ncbi:MAG: membrane-bound lytic murein transglycosylase MltF [Halomonadaceae bacterium]|nr:MAG: membrane-bound lytic murein transglycosylase MltF [Halomonadaceae bacterium]
MAILRPAALLLPLAFALSACGSDEAPSTEMAIEAPEESGVLRVATRNGSTTYYVNRHEQPAGPEHDLVMAFAQAQGLEVEWDMVHSTSAVLRKLENGEVHLGAAGLTHLPNRNARFERGPAHTEIRQQVVCNRESRPLIRSLNQLANSNVELHVTDNSSYAETLETLAQSHEGLSFTLDNEVSTEVLLTRVAQGQLSCTVADSNIVQVNQRFQPNLEVAFDLTEGQNIGWYLPKGSSMARTARAWMNSTAGDEAISAMENRYFAYIEDFDFVDLRALNRRIEDRLPQFREMFEEAAERTGVAPDLLAALAYQESHWDPQARSPTGVRGLMMLTGPTARELGVTDRLDPEQSIDAGARYLADRHRRLSADIAEPDRMFLALASYNVGRGHLLDARQLARDLNRDPDRWTDMETVLPLLADDRYYPNLRYGYARGYEPVHYVQRIRNYRDVISEAFE